MFIMFIPLANPEFVTNPGAVKRRFQLTGDPKTPHCAGGETAKREIIPAFGT
jgi:hypothetical protein